MAKTMGTAAKDQGRNDQRQGSRGSQSRRTDRTPQGEGSGGTRASSLAIEEWSIERVIPYDKNPRVNDAAVDAVARSIQEFGFRQPIVVDAKGVVIVGHTRLKAAKKLGLATVPVHVAKMTHAQAKAYRIADNQTATIAEWDKELLPIEILELKEMDFDLELLGFDKAELDQLLRLDNEGLCDPDEVPEVPADPITKPGDLWILGEHRLLCGDSTKAEDVQRLMGGAKADLCLTDPPYGLGAGKESGKNAYDQHSDTKENLISLASGWLPIARDLCRAVVFSPGVTNAWIYPEADWILCWFYGGGQLRSSWGFNCWQPFLCYGKDPSLASGNGARPDAVDMNTPANAADINHPCPKPIKLWGWLINRLSFGLRDLIYEPFSGSGTTIIACEQLNRRCYAIEISPQYVQVALERWRKFTGKEPVLESTGKTLAEMETNRA